MIISSLHTHILEASAAPEVHLGVFTKHHKEQQQKMLDLGQ